LNQVCFDASAACAFALNDEPCHTQVLALVADLAGKQTQIIAPSLFLCECDSVIRLRVYKGALNDEEASQARRFVAALAVVIDDAMIYDRAFEIARIYNQPRTYDATYAALAELRGVELWTADKRFYNSVTSAKKPLEFVKFVENFK
jgi:predicted nucleic acid-binding protein